MYKYKWVKRICPSEIEGICPSEIKGILSEIEGILSEIEGICPSEIERILYILNEKIISL